MGFVIRIITGLIGVACGIAMIVTGINGPNHRYYENNNDDIQLKKLEIQGFESTLTYHNKTLSVFREYKRLCELDSGSSKINVEECIVNAQDEISNTNNNIMVINSELEEKLIKKQNYEKTFAADKVWFSWSWKIGALAVFIFLISLPDYSYMIRKRYERFKERISKIPGKIYIINLAEGGYKVVASKWWFELKDLEKEFKLYEDAIAYCDALKIEKLKKNWHRAL